MPAERAVSRRYVPPRSTSLPAVLDAALRIVDEEGVEALSMRRLADDLGIGAMTLYRYVATKDVLYDELVTLVLGELAATPVAGQAWRSSSPISSPSCTTSCVPIRGSPRSS